MVIFGTILGVLVFYFIGFIISFVLGSHKEFIPLFSNVAWGAIFGFSVSAPFSLLVGLPLSWKSQE